MPIVFMLLICFIIFSFFLNLSPLSRCARTYTCTHTHTQIFPNHLKLFFSDKKRHFSRIGGSYFAVLQCSFWCLTIIKFDTEKCTFGSNTTEVNAYPSAYIRRYIVSNCPIDGTVNFDYDVKVGIRRLNHYEVTLFLLEISNLWETTLRLCIYPVPYQTFTH